VGVRGLPTKYGRKGGGLMNQTLGDRLKYALEIRNMKQCDFAKKIGLTEVTMSRYINGTRKPKADTIVIICRTLGISSDWLLGML
jgi:transcriptional regulator with XRE-family HTH domain